MVIDNCPACGYPKFGPGLCAFCAPGTAPDDALVSTPELKPVRHDDVVRAPAVSE